MPWKKRKNKRNKRRLKNLKKEYSQRSELNLKLNEFKKNLMMKENYPMKKKKKLMHTKDGKTFPTCAPKL